MVHSKLLFILQNPAQIPLHSKAFSYHVLPTTALMIILNIYWVLTGIILHPCLSFNLIIQHSEESDGFEDVPSP